MNRLRVLIPALCLAACGGEPETLSGPAASTPEPASTVEAKSKRDPLPEYFDCVREAGGALIAAHRGGPAPGYPENALETLQRGLGQGITVFEIDVAESQDSVQFLMHDRTLGRTTTGDGPLVEKDWTDIAALRLVDNAGTVTSFAPPRFTDVLLWAKENGAILELDRKPSTSFRNIIANVRAAGAEDHVILISYNDNQAEQIATLGPKLMLTASARNAKDIELLQTAGVDRDRLIAWTGTDAPDAKAWSRVSARGVEAAFGTLGRPGERLDDAYAADGDLSEYQALAEDGLVLLATDAPFAAAQIMTADDLAYKVCGR